jgi:hypothetical protein
MTTNSPDAGVDVISREAALDAVPTNWCDSLLTGPDAALRKIGNYDGFDIERLLNAIRDRIKALPTSPPSREETIELLAEARQVLSVCTDLDEAKEIAPFLARIDRALHKGE